MKALVGYTGFVGSNLFRSGAFDCGFNTGNIEDAYGQKPDLLVYAGVRAEKYLANEYPDRDVQIIRQAEDNIKYIEPKKLVLISTVDVLQQTALANEDTEVVTENLHPYGYHRYMLENWVRENYEDALIIRLPALFGIHIKKNFIYDYIKKIPFVIKKEKMKELSGKCPDILNYYTERKDHYFQCNVLTSKEEEQLTEVLEKVSFSALHFTDSRNSYQFYPLARLWDDIQRLLEQQVTLWHPATEPITAGELFYELSGKAFCNEFLDKPIRYHFTTKYASLFGKTGDYICEKAEILREIRMFVESMQA